MKKMKRWTYTEVTAATEDKIKRLMAMAEKESDPATVKFIHHWAYGVYDGWLGLTMGWQEDGDDERMRKLTEK